MNRNELYHYGVKGMKWHKRRGQTDDEDLNLPHSRKRHDNGKTGEVVKRTDDDAERDHEYSQHSGGHPVLPGHIYMYERKSRKRNYNGKTGVVRRTDESVSDRTGHNGGPVSGRRRTQFTEHDRELMAKKDEGGTYRKRKRGRKSANSDIFHGDFYGNELYHYGVIGMKWGVRRYQNSDGSLTPAGKAHQARLYSRELNAKDKSTIRVKRRVKEADANAANLEIRAKRTSNLSKKLDYETKAKNYRNSVSEERKAIEKNQKEIDALVKKIQKEGYSVNSKDVRRSSNTGADYAKALLLDSATVSVGALVGAPFVPLFVPGHTVEGKKYKVRG